MFFLLQQHDKLDFAFSEKCGIVALVMIMKKLCVLLVFCLFLAGCDQADVIDNVMELLPTQTVTQPEETKEPDEMTIPEETTLPPETQPEETQYEGPWPPATMPAPDMTFTPVQEQVTAKIEVNIRLWPSQEADVEILRKLENGQTILRTGISDTGWSRLEWNGQTCYAITSYLTTDLDYAPPVQIQTPFTATEEWVTPKDAVNLRTLPSTTHPEVEVVVKLEKGQKVLRTGINEDVGWSRVEWEGRTLYCISSYLRSAE